MPTEIVKYVDPDGGILADYTSLQAAITAEKVIRPDLVARDEVLKLMCISSAGSPDTTPVTINNGDFVTDATRNIIIQGDNSTGFYTGSHYKIDVIAGTNGYCIQANGYLTIKNIALKINGSGSYATAISAPNLLGIYLTVQNCVIVGGTGASLRGIEHVDSGGFVCINNVIYNFDFGVYVFANKSNALIANNTIFNAVKGLYNQSGSGYVLKNNIYQKSVNGTDGFSGTFDAASDYNISDIAADAPGANSLNSTTVNFADASAGDFRLLAGSPGIDQGVDLSSYPSYPFNTAIDGTIRPQGAAWDIGAFEYLEPFVYKELSAKIATNTEIRSFITKQLEISGIFDSGDPLRALIVADRQFFAVIKTDSRLSAQAVKSLAVSGRFTSVDQLRSALSADRRFSGQISSFSTFSARFSAQAITEIININAPGVTVLDLASPGSNVINLRTSYQ